MRKKIVKPLLFVVLSAVLLAAVLDKGVDDFDVNQLGDLYLVKDNILTKAAANGGARLSYSRPDYGRLSGFYAQDGLTLLAYYHDMQKVVFLDNNLTEKRSPVDLTDLGYSEAALVCPSYNKGFWLYDPAGMSLLRFNRLLQPAESSGNLNAYGLKVPAPIALMERANRLYLLDTLEGVFEFNRYGTFIKRLPFKYLQAIQPEGKELLMLKHDSLFVYHSETLHLDTLVLDVRGVRKFKKLGSRLYLLDRQGVLSVSPLPVRR